MSSVNFVDKHWSNGDLTLKTKQNPTMDLRQWTLHSYFGLCIECKSLVSPTAIRQLKFLKYTSTFSKESYKIYFIGSNKQANNIFLSSKSNLKRGVLEGRVARGEHRSLLRQGLSLSLGSIDFQLWRYWFYWYWLFKNIR